MSPDPLQTLSRPSPDPFQTLSRPSPDPLQQHAAVSGAGGGRCVTRWLGACHGPQQKVTQITTGQKHVIMSPVQNTGVVLTLTFMNIK